MATHAEIVEFLESKVEVPTTYGRIAAALGTFPRIVGSAIKNAPATVRKGHLVLRSDWTISPDFRSNGLGPDDAAARLEKDGYAVEQLPSGIYRLVNPPSQ